MVVPSLAFANNSQLTINEGSIQEIELISPEENHNVTILEAKLVDREQGEPIYHSLEIENNKVRLIDIPLIDNDLYGIEMLAEVESNGIKVKYFDFFSYTGLQLKEQVDMEIVPEENWKRVDFQADSITGENFINLNLNIHFDRDNLDFPVSFKSLEESYNYVYPSSTPFSPTYKIAISSSPSFNFYEDYLLEGDSFGVYESTDLTPFISDAVKVETQSNFNTFSMGWPTETANIPIRGDLYISPGSHYTKYSGEESSWEGYFDYSTDMTFEFTPNGSGITLLEEYESEDSGQWILKFNTNFFRDKLELIGITDMLTYTIYDGDRVVATSSYQFYQRHLAAGFDMSNEPSGEYSIEASIVIGGITFATGKTQAYYDASDSSDITPSILIEQLIEVDEVDSAINLYKLDNNEYQNVYSNNSIIKEGKLPIPTDLLIEGETYIIDVSNTIDAKDYRYIESFTFNESETIYLDWSNKKDVFGVKGNWQHENSSIEIYVEEGRGLTINESILDWEGTTLYSNLEIDFHSKFIEIKDGRTALYEMKYRIPTTRDILQDEIYWLATSSVSNDISFTLDGQMKIHDYYYSTDRAHDDERNVTVYKTTPQLEIQVKRKILLSDEVDLGNLWKTVNVASPNELNLKISSGSEPLQINYLDDLYRATFDIEDPIGNIVQKDIETTSLNSIILSENLETGVYVLVLKSDTDQIIDEAKKEVVYFVVEDENAASQVNKIFVKEPNFSLTNSKLKVYEEIEGNDLSIEEMTWNGSNFETEDLLFIKPQDIYKVVYQSIDATTNTIYDVKIDVSGAELLNSAASPIKLFDGLKTTKIQLSQETINSNLMVSYYTSATRVSHSDIYNHESVNEDMTFISKGNKHVVEFKSIEYPLLETVGKQLFEVVNITSDTKDNSTVVDFSELVELNAYQSREEIIKGFVSGNPNGWSPNKGNDDHSVSIGKGYYPYLNVTVSPNTSAYNYQLLLKDITVDEDYLIDFHPAFTGKITKLKVYRDSISVNTRFETDGNQIIEAFNKENKEPFTYSAQIIDQNNKVVIDQEIERNLQGFSIPIYGNLNDGDYTVKITADIYPNQTIIIEQPFTYNFGVVDLQLNKDIHQNTINQNKVTLSGYAPAWSLITFDGTWNGEEILLDESSTDANGYFTQTIENLKDGTYSVTAKFNGMSDAIEFTIDTLPPVPPTDLVLDDKTVEGEVSLAWDGAPDAVAFQVEISEDGEEWKTLPHELTRNRASWTTVPGITYQVRLRAIDQAGNQSEWVTEEYVKHILELSTPAVEEKTNQQKFTVTGIATPESTVSLLITKDEATVASASTDTDEEGMFAYEMTDLTDGVYTITAKLGDVTSTRTLTIDQTGPIVANVTVMKTAEGIVLDWTHPKDAASYDIFVATNGETFTVLAENVNGPTYTMKSVAPSTTYTFKIVAYDNLGNQTEAIQSYESPSFLITSIKATKEQAIFDLVPLGSRVNIEMVGPYENHFTADASITLDGQKKELSLIYNLEKKAYIGSFQIPNGTKKVESVQATINDGKNTTAEVQETLNWNVSGTLQGIITDGMPLPDAEFAVYIDGTRYYVKSNEMGEFRLPQLPAGEFDMEVFFNGTTFKFGKVTVIAGEITQVEGLKLPEFVTPKLIFKDIQGNIITTTLAARINGPHGLISGSINAEGKFVYRGNQELNMIPAGDYTITVFGNGIYLDTQEVVNFTKASSDFTFTVKQYDANEQTINFTFPENATNIEAFSLWSGEVAEKSNYRYGNTYKTEITPADLVDLDVAAGDDYQLYIQVEGYAPYWATNVDFTQSGNYPVVLEKARTISGTITDAEGPVANMTVQVYSNSSYDTAVTDANGKYTLTNLSSKEDLHFSVFSTGIYKDVVNTITKSETDENNYDVTLAKAATFTGKIINEKNEPINQVNINLYDDQDNYVAWGRTGADGHFRIGGLEEGKTYKAFYYSSDYPMLEEALTDLTQEALITLKLPASGSLAGEGNSFAANKTNVAPGEEITYTMQYRNNGETAIAPTALKLNIDASTELLPLTGLVNGKPVTITGNTITLPEVAPNASGTVSFKVKVKDDVQTAAVNAGISATVAGEEFAVNATTSVVFVTLQAPAQTGTKELKVYGNAKKGSTVEVYQGSKLLGKTIVDSKYYYALVNLDVKEDEAAETVTLTAKAIDKDGTTAFSKPVAINYEPKIPEIQDVSVYAGWNGTVNLNPYTGLATFAITEHTPMDTQVTFEAGAEVDSVQLHFLGKNYDMTKNGDTFTFDGSQLGLWSSYGEQLLEVSYKTADNIDVRMPLMNIIVLIDPSGYVFEGSMDNRLSGVQAVVETLRNGIWVPWDAQKFGQVNPQTTDDEGRYGWDVITGKWRVVFTKDGYEPYISRVMDVPPVETELNIPMIRSSAPTVTTNTITTDNLTVAFDRPMVVNSANFELYKVSGDDRTKVAGTLIANNQLDGYESLDVTPEGKSSVENDSNDEVGFFAANPDQKVAASFTFKPTGTLEAGTTYELVISKDATDTAAKTLNEAVTLSFATTPAEQPEEEPKPEDPKPEDPNPGNPNPPTTNPPVVTPPVVTPPTDDVVVIEDGKVVVSKDKLEELFASPEARIGLDLTKVTGNVLPPVVFDSEALSKMKATQSIVLQLPNQQIELPAAVLQALAKEGGQVELNVEEVTSTEDGAISSQLNFNMNTYKDGKATAQTKFAAPITVSMKLNKAPKDPRKVAVFYVNGDAKTYMGGDVKDGMVTFTIDHFSSFVAVEGNKTFTDLPAYAKEAVEVLASRGIINGKTDTRYGSGDSITRAEFAVLVARSLALPTESYKGTFTDVPASMKWAAQHIEAANQAGIINGYNETSFKPGEKINRQEMAAMIVRALKYQNPDITVDESKFVNFLDSSDISSFAKKDVAMASAMGIINGFKSGKGYEFRPKQTATRGEAAKMLFEMLY